MRTASCARRHDGATAMLIRLRANDSHGPVVEEEVPQGTPTVNPRGCPACGGELGEYDLVYRISGPPWGQLSADASP